MAPDPSGPLRTVGCKLFQTSDHTGARNIGVQFQRLFRGEGPMRVMIQEEKELTYAAPEVSLLQLKDHGPGVLVIRASRSGGSKSSLFLRTGFMVCRLTKIHFADEHTVSPFYIRVLAFELR